MGTLVIIGTLDAWFLWGYEGAIQAHAPELYRAEFPAALRGNITSILGILLLDVPIVIGWLLLMLGKDELGPRLHWFWTPFGLFMATWGWLTHYGATALEEGRPITVLNLLSGSCEIWRSSAIGLLFAFYALGSAKPLWYWYWTWFVGGVVQGSGMLAIAVGQIEDPMKSYLRPEQAGFFWHYWGFFILDLYLLPLGLVAGYFIIKWRGDALEKENARHPRFWGFWEGIGLPFVMLRRLLKLPRVIRR